MNENREPILSAENITISFGGLKALDDVSLNIYPGEIFAIIGPNGAGKTTMLNVLNGFYKQDEGRIIFEGKKRSRRVKPDKIAAMGIARTFQNL
ncbi:MAG: ATP-binding cassette domain-containing protein, partial [Deltaproteobacteria bacterium]|nr:ATP-binding cassette domain-containing protein [Deltaproteobacteria bacterium]